MISNDNKFTLKPIFVFLPFLIVHTFIIVMETIYCFFIVVLFQVGWLAWGWGVGGHETSPSAASEVQPVVHGAKSVVSTQENPRLIISSCHPPMLCSFLIYLFFSATGSHGEWLTPKTLLDTPQRTLSYTPQESDLLKKDVVWLNNYNALDVVDEDCYTSLRKLQKGGLPCFQLFFFFLNIRF